MGRILFSVFLLVDLNEYDEHFPKLLYTKLGMGKYLFHIVLFFVKYQYSLNFCILYKVCMQRSSVCSR